MYIATKTFTTKGGRTYLKDEEINEFKYFWLNREDRLNFRKKEDRPSVYGKPVKNTNHSTDYEPGYSNYESPVSSFAMGVDLASQSVGSDDNSYAPPVETFGGFGGGDTGGAGSSGSWDSGSSYSSDSGSSDAGGGGDSGGGDCGGSD